MIRLQSFGYLHELRYGFRNKIYLRYRNMKNISSRKKKGKTDISPLST